MHNANIKMNISSGLVLQVHCDTFNAHTYFSTSFLSHDIFNNEVQLRFIPKTINICMIFQRVKWKLVCDTYTATMQILLSDFNFWPKK